MGRSTAECSRSTCDGSRRAGSFGASRLDDCAVSCTTSPSERSVHLIPGQRGRRVRWLAARGGETSMAGGARLGAVELAVKGSRWDDDLHDARAAGALARHQEATVRQPGHALGLGQVPFVEEPYAEQVSFPIDAHHWAEPPSDFGSALQILVTRRSSNVEALWCGRRPLQG